MSSQNEHPEQFEWDQDGHIGHCQACELEHRKNNGARVPLELHDCNKEQCQACAGFGQVNMTHLFRGTYTGGTPCARCNGTGRTRKER